MYNEIIVGNTKKIFINKDINFSLKFNLYYFIKYSSIYAAGAGTVKGSVAYGAGAGIVECPAVYSEGAGNVEGPAAYGAGAGTVEGPGPSVQPPLLQLRIYRPCPCCVHLPLSPRFPDIVVTRIRRWTQYPALSKF